MLKVTYGQLRDTVFARGMAKMVGCSSLKSPKVAYNVAKINQRLLDEAKQCDELYQKLVEKYAKKTEDGKLEPHEGKPGTFVIAEANAEAWQAEVKDLYAIVFEIDRPKIDLMDVQTPAGLSPMEITALEPVLDTSSLEASPDAEVPGKGLRAVKD